MGRVLPIVGLASLLLAACATTPTPDVAATMQAGVSATQAAQATEEAAVMATQAAQPTATPTIEPTATLRPSSSPAPTLTPTQPPSPTPPPTATPTPTATATVTQQSTATAMAAPPTSTSAPTGPPEQDTRGIAVNAYWVVGAPGPFGVGQDIWFHLDVTNASGQMLEYDALGTWVEETGQLQKSWSHSSLTAGKNLLWDDHISIDEPGTYSLWLAIQFSDGTGVKLAGPITVTVE